MTFFRLSDPDHSSMAVAKPVVAIGNFDGVHRGHQIVLQHAINEAEVRGTRAIALTFEPHPRTVFKPDAPVYRLSPAVLKAKVLAAMGIGGVVELTFDKAFSSQSAQSFVDDVLLGLLDACHVVTGYDFHFGKGRAGSPEFLLAAGQSAGFGVTVVEAQNDEGGDIVSSSRVRGALEKGDVPLAAGLLGYRPLITGTVVKGAQLGRQLGYPTANIELPDNTQLKHGIYAVRFRRADGTLNNGVASFGRRPTVNSGDPLFETYVFDFSGDLYGEDVTISLVSYLRGEEKFDGVEALIEQMDKDADEARQVLMHAQALSPLDGKLTFAVPDLDEDGEGLP